jgi:hypothetical protein
MTFQVNTVSEPKKPLENPTGEIQQLRTALQEKELELEYARNKGKLIARELDLFRQRRVVQWMDRFRNRFDAWNMIASPFQQLKDDCVLFNGELKNYCLQPSVNLNRVPFLSYDVRLDRKNLKSILIAPIVDVPLLNGELNMQILNDNELIAQSTVQIATIYDDRPLEFEFEPIKDSNRGQLTLHISVHKADAPIRIFEMRRYKYFGLGPVETRAFCGFLFDR